MDDATEETTAMLAAIDDFARESKRLYLAGDATIGITFGAKLCRLVVMAKAETDLKYELSWMR